MWSKQSGQILYGVVSFIFRQELKVRKSTIKSIFFYCFRATHLCSLNECCKFQKDGIDSIRKAFPASLPSLRSRLKLISPPLLLLTLTLLSLLSCCLRMPHSSQYGCTLAAALWTGLQLRKGICCSLPVSTHVKVNLGDLNKRLHHPGTPPSPSAAD